MESSRIIVAAFAMAAILCQTARAQKVDPLLQSLWDAGAAQAAREAAAGCYEFEESRRTTSEGGKASDLNFVYVVARKPGFIRIASAKSEKGAIIYCENPSYTFAAFKKGTEAYRLGHYSSGTGYGNQVGKNSFNTYVKDYFNVVRPISGFLGDPLGEQCRTGFIKPERVTPSASDTVLEYTMRIPLDGGQVLTTIGKARFDADLRLASVSARGPSEYEMKRTYNARHPDGGAFTDTEESTIQMLPLRIVQTLKYRMLADPVPDDREFYMSHYGLPEPIGGIAPAGPWPYWVWIVVAAGCALVAYAFFRLARRAGSGRIVPADPPSRSN